jgi:hypothetical protein
MQYGRTLLLVAAALTMGLVAWSCSADENATPKPDKGKVVVDGTAVTATIAVATPTTAAPTPTVAAPTPTVAAPTPTVAAPTPTTPAAGGEKMVPLELKPVQPKGVVTPINIPLDAHMEPLDAKRPQVMIPEGSTNLALKKKVTGSTTFFITGDLPIITDGDVDGSEGGFVELDPGKQWVQIDLGQESAVYAVVLYHYALQNRAYHDVIIQVSDDADFIKGVKTVFNNDYDNSSGLGVGKDMEYIEDYKGRAIPVAGVTGRYVRVYSNGDSTSDRNHCIEIEVWGKAAK